MLFWMMWKRKRHIYRASVHRFQLPLPHPWFLHKAHKSSLLLLTKKKNQKKRNRQCTIPSDLKKLANQCSLDFRWIRSTKVIAFLFGVLFLILMQVKDNFSLYFWAFSVQRWTDWMNYAQHKFQQSWQHTIRGAGLFRGVMCYGPLFWFCILVKKEQMLQSDWNIPDFWLLLQWLPPPPLLKFLATPHHTIICTITLVLGTCK